MSGKVRRFPPPWQVTENQESFVVTDATGQKLAYFYFDDIDYRRSVTKRMSRDEAFLLAVNFAKLPMVPRSILKDIPRPPRSVSTE